MNKAIENFISTFSIRGITSREVLLGEMLRAKLTANAAKLLKDISPKDNQVFELMKQTTENTILGYFPGDKDLFSAAYHLSKEIDLIQYTLKLYQNDRFGQIISPVYLTEYVADRLKNKQPESILVAEAEKSLAGLTAFIKCYPNSKITFTTSNVLMHLLLQTGFATYENVTIVNQSIYQELLVKESFDVIYTLPNFGGKVEAITNQYISGNTDGIALQNLLNYLAEDGTLIAILPARITFAGSTDARLRDYIIKNYQLHSIFGLPEGIFKPYTAIKTYLLSIGRAVQENINIGYLGYDNGLSITDEQAVPYKEFIEHEDWRIELMLANDDETIWKYKNSTIAKVKLHEVAEVFRGKSILKKDVKPGSILVLNISNITDVGIDYETLDNIDEEERKIKRYELLDGDVVLSCRGAGIKVGVFRQQKNIVIASANVIVIRPNDKVRGEYLQIFFESPIGMAVVKSFQRGTTIVNINHTDIMEMEIPLLSSNEQADLVAAYQTESVLYRETINKAEKRYVEEKEKIYAKLL